MTDPVQPRPQPVIDAAAIGGKVSAALVAVSSVYFLVQAGIDPHSIGGIAIAVQSAVTALVALLVYVLPLLHAKKAAAQVTPLADPVDTHGTTLVPKGHPATGATEPVPTPVPPVAAPDPGDGHMQAGLLDEPPTAPIPLPTAPATIEPRRPEQITEQWARDLEDWVHKLHAPDRKPQEPHRVNPYIRRPHTATQSLTAVQVAKAYGYDKIPGTGKGVTVGVIELGGAVNASDMTALGYPAVTVVDVDGDKPVSDGPNGADGEVMLDVEVIAAVAPDAKIRAYFAPNSDAGFLAAIEQATSECDVVSISWGGPEDQWDAATMDAYDAAFAAAKAAGVNVFCASGDAGSGDGETGKHVDFPASSPHVVGCGGTRLTINADGSRSAEVVWNDGTSSAGGGGVSVHFPGRDVPDVAGNADPQTGYQIRIDGGNYVIGGTSAVAPLYAALCARLMEAHGSRFDFMALVLANPTIAFDVTSGNNGAFRAGPGRDEATGFGVVDGGLAWAKLGTPVAPPVPPTPPAPPAVTIPALWVAWAKHTLTLKDQSRTTVEVAKEIVAAAGE